MTKRQRNYFFLGSIVSVFVMAATLFFPNVKGNFKLLSKATSSANYSVSFNRTICGSSGYSNNNYTKESKLARSGQTVYAHAVNAMVTSGTDFARFKADSSAHIEFYIDPNTYFQEITGFSLTYNASYPYGDFDIYLSHDGTSYPSTPDVQVSNAPATVSLNSTYVKKIKFVGKVNKYAYFDTITINYACGDPAPITLSSISVSGQKDVFGIDDTFEFNGTVTAHYSDYTTSDVTSSAVIDTSGVDLSTAGEYEVGVSYSDSSGSAATSYSVTVKEGGEITTVTYSYSYSTSTYEMTILSDGTGYYSYIYNSSTYYTIHFTWSVLGSTYTFTKDEKTGDSEYAGNNYYHRCLFGGSNTINTGKLDQDVMKVKLRTRDGDTDTSDIAMSKVV